MKDIKDQGRLGENRPSRRALEALTLQGVAAPRTLLPTTLGEAPGACDPPLLPQHSTAPQWSTRVPSCPTQETLVLFQ